jgi:hypothetical protein
MPSVEKDRFLNLIQNFTSLSEEEANELNALQKDYPFSQVVHSLAARAAQDNQLQNHNQLLGLSAIYSTDRSVLKLIMTRPQIERQKGSSPSIPSIQVNSIHESVTSIDGFLHGDALIHEVEMDLARLKELKQNFEMSWGEYNPAYQLEVTKEKTKGKKINPPDLQDDGLIEEIKSSKKEIGLEGEKQKEQIQIIDNFIKTSPSIPKGKSAPVVQGDLAENSNAFGDHIVSETLVEILLKQGKKDKAVEVLRKLIWKFPQKKSIFAAQIEELKR